VGKQKVEFGVHKGLFVAKSPFFEKCFGVGMKEENDSVVNLPEDEPSAFELVVEWVYADRIRAIKPVLTITKAYVLADKLCMPDLQNILANAIRLAPDGPGPYNANCAWQILPEGCPIRDLVVDQLHFQIMSCSNKFKLGTADTDAKLAMALKKMTQHNPGLAEALFWKTVDYSLNKATGGPVDPRKLTGCHYHVHEDGKKCK
jgi:hypothetical protein